MKRAFIKDPLWGNIEFYTWEKPITSHFILNRLTNVVQNSSAYRAYPGLKYSRFLHTLGVVHVVTQLFVSAVDNAKDKHKQVLACEAASLRAKLTEEQTKLIQRSILFGFGGNADFHVLLAVLRASAFIHDLGHLPYSHVFENALDSFLADGIESYIKITKDAEQKRKILNSLLHEGAGDKIGERDKIHEIVGIRLGGALAKLLGHADDKDSQLASALIKLACELLRSDQFPISKSFIKGTIDADRIDFVRRDGHFSGLFNTSVDYGRLFSMYSLGSIKPTEGMKQISLVGIDNPDSVEAQVVEEIIAMPSERATSESEKLIWERFQDYKYIVVHHKVHLFDEIVENILVRLLAAGQLELFTENLIYLLGPDVERQDNIHGAAQHLSFLQNVLLEFDDIWIENRIREVYRKNLRVGSNDGDFGAVLFRIYVEERNRLVTAFKSDTEFWNAADKYAKGLAELCPKPGAIEDVSATQRRLNVSKTLYAAKFGLQAALSKEFGCTVVVGPTDRKVSYGVKNDDEARLYQLSELVAFLKQKKYSTRLFNLWFEEKPGLTKEVFIPKALKLIEDFVSREITGLASGNVKRRKV